MSAYRAEVPPDRAQSYQSDCLEDCDGLLEREHVVGQGRNVGHTLARTPHHVPTEPAVHLG